MALTTPEAIEAILRQCYDPQRVESLYRKAVYSFGGAWDRSVATTHFGGIVECPDIVVDYLEIGQSRRILNTALISMAGTMYAQPSPEFQGIDKHTAEIRKQYLLKRSEGDAGESEWADEDEMAYLDGDGLGFGGCQICLKTNPKTGYQRVSLEHIPAFHVIYDRVSRGFGSSRLVAFVKYLAPEEFESRWGERARADCEDFLYSHSLGAGGEALRVCRVIEYYDMGIGKSEPTRAVIAKDFGGDVLEHGPNTLECLPFAHYQHWLPIGSRYPIGRIDSQMGTHEALNEVERTIRRQTKKQGFGFVDTDQIDEDDLQSVIDGEADFVRFNKGGSNNPPYHPAQGQEVTQTTLEWMNSLERQFTTDSGQTDLDRGNQLEQTKTLGEAQLLVGRSQSQGSRSALEAVKYHLRKYRLVSKIAQKFDLDPLEVDVYGMNLTLNDPEQPASAMSNWFRDAARITLSEEALRYQDLRAQRGEKLQELQLVGRLLPGVGASPWYAEQVFEAIGVDPKEAMGGQVAGAALQGGAPVPPPPNGAAAPGLPGMAQ